MPKSVLFRRSSFFVDVFNVMYHIDLFLYHEMKERLKTNECLQYFFSDKIPTIEPNPQNDPSIVRLLANKKNKNVLLDWMNKDKFNELNNSEILDLYLENLRKDMLENPICNQYLQLTGFGHTIRMLVGDTNTNKVNLCIPYHADVITESIKESFNGYAIDKLGLYTGEKVADAKEFVADSYILEDVRDVDKYLCKKHNHLIEVVVPAYEYNLMEDRTRSEKMIEQITITRLKLEHDERWYKDNYNLSINNIAVPI